MNDLAPRAPTEGLPLEIAAGTADVPEASEATVILNVGIQSAVNAALWANHVPILSDLTLVNSGAEPLGEVRIDLESVPPAIRPKTWRLAEVAPGQMRALTDFDLTLDGPWLTSLTEAVRGTVTVTAWSGDRLLAETRHDVRFLAHNEWGGTSVIPDLLAAFVEPNDPAVASILHKASDLLRAQGKPDGLEGYQATSKARLWEQIAAVWSAVCSLDIRYVNPPPSFESQGQRIRPPRQILDERLGTCLDLAVLFAACLEQVGLRPLIVFTEGHAFTGAWLARHDFGSSVASDAPSLRTRLALNDLVLFETTLSCQSPAPGLKRASQVGADQVAPHLDTQFRAVIDVHRARQRHIRPLSAPPESYARHPVAPGIEGDETLVVGPPLIEEAPLLREDAELEEAEPSPTSPADRLTRWRKRLLDLSGRNRLLNLRLGGKQALPIDCPDVAVLEDMLSQMRGSGKHQPIRFRPWPDVMSGTDPRSAQIYRDRLNEEASQTFALQALAKRELLIGRNDTQLQDALTDLYRTARAAQQEGGANTLFVTIGSLMWKPTGKEKPYRAPLILVPAILERPSVRSGFQLRAHEDETRINSTLLELLRQDFDLRLPELEQSLPEDGSGIDVTAILDVFRRKLREIPGWEVIEDVTLTNLSFTKYLMWKDLSDRADTLRQSEVARRLMDGPADRELPEGVVASVHGNSGQAGAALDDELPPAEFACPLEADSSQLRAVAAAAKGESFVLIGPPGTGKSQTIANIIANTLAQGRTVLFVAEKRAALEVVQRRMNQVHLGDFCLDLFSAKASKMAVLEQLGRAQTAREGFDEADWTHATQEMSEVRAELNCYVRELHRRGRNGWTAYRAIGCVLRSEAGGIPEVQFGWPSADIHDIGDFQRLVEATEDAAAMYARLGDFADYDELAGIEHTEWSPNWQTRLADASRDAIAALENLNRAIGPMLRALSLPPETAAARPDLEGLESLISLVLDPHALAAGWALGANSDETCETLYAAEALAAEHADLAGTLTTEWRASATELPLDAILAEWREASQRWVIPRRSGLKKVRERLAPALVGKMPDDPTPDIQTLVGMKAKEAELAALGQQIAPVLGRRWNGLQTDFSQIKQAIAFSARLRAATAACAVDPVGLLALREHLTRLLGTGADLLVEEGSVGRPLRAFRNAWSTALDAVNALTSLCGGDPRAAVSETSLGWALALAEHLRGWVSGAHRLRDWCAWRGTVQKAGILGLSPLLAAMEGGVVGPEDAPRVFEANYARWWLNLAVDDLPRVRAFVAAQHEQRIDRFRALDRRLLDLSSRLIRSRLAASIPGTLERKNSPEFALLTRELAKRQRHLPVRQLVSRMPNTLRKLTPCLMMSPLSVAQYLPAETAPFDLVIFDEASQIPTWDAIGAVGRGRQVIVVGDPKQLPPTRFFERQVPGPEENGENQIEVETEDLESILDECIGAGISTVELTWHYRSRHESLIAFSNQQYYGGRLITFPSPKVRDGAVSYRHVPDGVYARSGARTNQAEAKAVVAEVVSRLRKQANDGKRHSIGIVSFNAEQQALIENLLDEERRADPSLEHFFSDDEEEPVLVKNLEGVQGEERDIIIFSLTYGPDVTGRVAMNFGPLNQSGGERRLNVAVTRARQALIAFGSLRPEHIDLSRTSAIGVAHLKQFLVFAEHGARAFATAATGPLGDFESPFEAEVAELLRAKGWTVHPQIGVSGFRVDLGIVNPDAPGEFLAGIECDGATYHRSASARDRDRLRQSVLEGLGWTVLRIWSTDWWTNAHRETTRLDSVLRVILEGAREAKENAERASSDGQGEQDVPVGDTPDLPDGPDAGAPVADVSGTVPAGGDAGGMEAADAVGGIPPEVLTALDPAAFYEEAYRPRLAALVVAILRSEAPIRDERLAQRVARAHGFHRTGRRIKEATLAVLPDGCSTTQEDIGLFIWPPNVSPAAWSTFRDPAPGKQREPAETPFEELVALARRVLCDGMSNEEALLAMRNACGLEKLREAARERCLRAIERCTDRE